MGNKIDGIHLYRDGNGSVATRISKSLFAVFHQNKIIVIIWLAEDFIIFKWYDSILFVINNSPFTVLLNYKSQNSIEIIIISYAHIIVFCWQSNGTIKIHHSLLSVLFYDDVTITMLTPIVFYLVPQRKQFFT